MKAINFKKNNERNSFGDQIWVLELINLDTGAILDSYTEVNHEGNHQDLLSVLDQAKLKFGL